MRARLVPRTIGGQVLAASVATLLVALGTLAAVAPILAQRHATDDLGERLRGDAALVADLAREALGRRDAPELDALARRVGAAAGIRVTLVAPSGEVLGESDEDRTAMDDHAGRPEVAAALRGEVGRSVRHSTTVGRDLLYVAVPVRDGSRVVGAARMAFPVERLDALAARLASAILLAAAAGVIVALAVGAILGRAITQPLRELAASARVGELAIQPIAASVEVRDLSDALSRAWRDAASERRGMEAERDRLAMLVRELGDAVLIAGPDERVRLANPAAQRLLDAGPLDGRRLVDVVREHEILAAIASARSAGEAVVDVERREPARALRVVARRLPDGDLLLAVQDLTAVRRLETVRRDFVANVSHELRTPIASIKAMIEALERGALGDPAAARDFLGRMHTEIDDLAQLVSELLQLGRVESGQDRPRLETLAPDELIRASVERLAPLAERASVGLGVDPIGAQLPPVRADRERIAQVLTNIIHNAIKFTPAGGNVVVGVAREKGAIRFHVRDTGVGLRRDEVERVFERFYKGERSRAGTGTGLGLAIAKHIVQTHGGNVSAESAGMGQGSTFSFTLPVASGDVR